MPKLRNPEQDFIYAKLWEKAYNSKIEIDFSNDKQGKFLAQKLWKDLDNFRLYIFSKKLSGFYFKLFRKINCVELLLKNDKIILRKKSEIRLQTLHNRRIKKFFNPPSLMRPI